MCTLYFIINLLKNLIPSGVQAQKVIPMQRYKQYKERAYFTKEHTKRYVTDKSVNATP